MTFFFQKNNNIPKIFMKVIVPFIITNLLARSGPKNLVAPRCFNKLLFINQVFVPLIEQLQVLLSLP